MLRFLPVGQENFDMVNLTQTGKAWYTISTLEEWQAMIAKHCVGHEVPRTLEFPAAYKQGLISDLSEHNRLHGFAADVCVTSYDMALGMLEVTPSSSLEKWNLKLGKGKATEYFWSAFIEYNRVPLPSAMGTSHKGLIHDMTNGQFIYGPQSVIDTDGKAMSIMHRLLCMVIIYKETGYWPESGYWLKVDGNFHPVLATKQDKARVHTIVDDKAKNRLLFTEDQVLAFDIPRIESKSFDQQRQVYVTYLTKILTELHGRKNGTVWHPSGPDSPNDDQMYDLRSSIGDEKIINLILRVVKESTFESGEAKPCFEKKKLSIPMLCVLVILASNIDWEEGLPIDVDPNVLESIIEWVNVSSPTSTEGFSTVLAHLVSAEGGAKALTQRDRRIFDALVKVTGKLLNGEPAPDKPLFTGKDTVKGFKNYAHFGGLDAGPKRDEE